LLLFVVGLSHTNGNLDGAQVRVYSAGKRNILNWKPYQKQYANGNKAGRPVNRAVPVQRGCSRWAIESLCSSGSYGSGNGQFNDPSGIAIDSLDNIWVADRDNSRVQEFTSGGVYIGQFGSQGSGNGQFSYLARLAVAPSGNIWVTDMTADRIQEFAPTPEPASPVLLCIGAASLFAYAWRRRRQAA
jgi:hypothetical protein